MGVDNVDAISPARHIDKIPLGPDIGNVSEWQMIQKLHLMATAVACGSWPAASPQKCSRPWYGPAAQTPAQK